MDALLEAQCLALGAMQRACARQPAVHAHQLIALHRECELCSAAVDIDDYQRRGGGFEVARAGWLDRVAGRVRVAQVVGDLPAAAAALAEYSGALAARCLGDWPDTLAAAARAAAPAQARAALAGRSATRTLHHLVLGQTSVPTRAEHHNDTLAAWQAWCEADPAAAAALWHGGPLPARVATRLPWHGLRDGERALADLAATLPAPPAGGMGSADAGDATVRLNELAAHWQRSCLGARAETGRPWARAALTADAALQPWRALASPGPGASPSAQAVACVAVRMLEVAAGAANGPEVQRRLIESGLSAAMAAAPLYLRLDAIDARQAVWLQPLLAAHARGLRAGLAQVETDTEVELLATHAEACLAVEADWQTLLFAAALAPLQTALLAAMGDTAAERGLRPSAALAHDLLGLGPRALLREPVVCALLGSNLAPVLFGPTDHADAWHAEVGHELLPPLRAWLAVAAARGRQVPGDGRTLLTSLRRLVARHHAAHAATDAAPLQLWGQRAPAAGWRALLHAPPRPPLPGWRAGVAAAGPL